jgi:hypothetical protein
MTTICIPTWRFNKFEPVGLVQESETIFIQSYKDTTGGIRGTFKIVTRNVAETVLEKLKGRMKSNA